MQAVRIYIAGPMTGIPSYNIEAFREAADRFRLLGWTPLIPHDLNSIVWRRHFGRDFDPTRDVCEYGDPILNEMVAEDLKQLCSAHAIALLPGWEKSRGARAEALIANNLKMHFFDAQTGRERAAIFDLDFRWAWPAFVEPHRGNIAEFVDAAIGQPVRV